MKDMITSGGENIFPVEIEDVLMDHPDIDDVACIGYPDIPVSEQSSFTLQMIKIF